MTCRSRSELFLLCVIFSFLTGNVILGQTPDVVNPIKLDAAVHVDKMERSRQQGDTLIHNAAAYQVAQGADSESLLAKMPGIAVSESGVEAGGKDVQRILLDGQEFFGNDVLTALRTVPADMVKQVEVINRLSDNARMTGVDDGEGYMAINIVTKRKKGDVMFAGRAYGSYGLSEPPEDKNVLRNNYIAGGNISRFADKRTLNIVGMSNNISKFNFTSSDILSGASGLNEGSKGEFNVKALSGISSVHSLGANYSDEKMNFSYFFNLIDNENRPQSEKLTMTSDEERKQSVTGHSSTNAHNMSHRFSGKITLNPSKQHSLVIRPEVTFEDLYTLSDSYARYRYVYSDDRDPKYLRNQLNTTSNDRWSLRASMVMSYRYAFKKNKRRALTAYVRYGYYNFDADVDSWQYRFNREDTDYDLDGEDLTSTYIQAKDNKTNQHSGTAKVSYLEPVTKRSRLAAEYTAQFTNTAGDNIASVLNNKSGEYEDSDRMSGVSTSTFLHNRFGGRYNYAFRKISVMASVNYQHTLFRGDVVLPDEGNTRKNYHHVLYQMTANIPFKQGSTIRLEAKGRTANPGNNMLQNVVNMSSTSNIRAGNPDVVPAYLHEAELRFTHTDKKTASTFSLLASYTFSSNYFCDSLVINQPDFEVMEGVKLGENNQYVKPINLKGYHVIYAKAAYGLPVSWLRCNLNINGTVSLRRIPSMVNEDYVPVNNNWYQMEGRLDSNISKNLDFTVGYNARYTSNEYSGKFGKMQNNFFLHRVSAKLKWIFLGGFTFTGAAQYRQYVSTSGLYNDRMVLCDIFFGRKFLPSRNLEVSVGVNDLFNDNTRHYWHTVNASGTNDGYNIGLGRFFSVQCIWHIRNQN